MPERRVLVTGSRGFIGKNLVLRLAEAGVAVSRFDRGDDPAKLVDLLADVDAVVHLAGVNRPTDNAEFTAGNAALTARLCAAMAESGRLIPLVVTSSRYATRADDSTLGELHRLYGQSKREAEVAAEELAKRTGSPVRIYRLPGVFGKWCKPSYNSVVATFCYKVARGLPLTVNSPDTPLQLVYVDDLIDDVLVYLETPSAGVSYGEVLPEHHVTLGELATLVTRFRDGRLSLMVEPVGEGFTRALYATYVSYLEPSEFSYRVPSHSDPRGTFAELVKTTSSGQFSFFTAHPGVTRGGHYHHTKTEKFVVVSGRARFCFRNVITGITHVVETDGSAPEVVETVPGWAHDITNIGEEEMLVLLWANERFDPSRPDTIAAPCT